MKHVACALTLLALGTAAQTAKVVLRWRAVVGARA